MAQAVDTDVGIVATLLALHDGAETELHAACLIGGAHVRAVAAECKVLQGFERILGFEPRR